VELYYNSKAWRKRRKKTGNRILWKLCIPFANLIVILFGVPFASIRKKGGLAIQMGAAMVISFST